MKENAPLAEEVAALDEVAFFLDEAMARDELLVSVSFVESTFSMP